MASYAVVCYTNIVETPQFWSMYCPSAHVALRHTPSPSECTWRVGQVQAPTAQKKSLPLRIVPPPPPPTLLEDVMLTDQTAHEAFDDCDCSEVKATFGTELSNDRMCAGGILRGRTVRCACAVPALCEQLAVFHHR